MIDYLGAGCQAIQSIPAEGMCRFRWFLCIVLIATTLTTPAMGSDLGEGSVEDIDDHTELDSRSGGHHVKLLP